MASKVSFTVRRPTPVSRATSSGPESDVGSSFKVPQLPKHLNGNSAAPSPLARSHTSSPNPRGGEAEENNQAYDSSDEESINEDELVTGFDRFGVQRANGEKKVQKPLVIPALKNKDWRELARKRRGASQYVPPSAAAQTGADGSVGGLGTKDTINSGPVLSGLQVKQRTLVKQEDDVTVQEVVEDVKMEVVEEETDDQKALRAILAEASGEVHNEGAMIDIIPTPISEAEALKQDVEELPDAATLEDYNRVPVSQFGAAMLRGMGWKEGTAATRKPGKGLVEPYIPAARPALLGIGAKEQEVYDDGSKKKGSGSKRPERRYVPIIKQERSETSSPAAGAPDKRERSRSPRRSAPSSRKPSPDRYNSRTERDGESRRRYDDHDRHRDSDRRRTDERSRRDDYREKDRSERRDRDKDRRRDRDGDRERPDRRPDNYDSSRRKKDY
ncbi:hypothetical protein CPC08DRAFT_787373 [Agrocybe pediades]|nr:hypothetical protein CPC08DRAFT_787373 [Agrocybe pediades]